MSGFLLSHHLPLPPKHTHTHTHTHMHTLTHHWIVLVILSFSFKSTHRGSSLSELSEMLPPRLQSSFCPK